MIRFLQGCTYKIPALLIYLQQNIQLWNIQTILTFEITRNFVVKQWYLQSWMRYVLDKFFHCNNHSICYCLRENLHNGFRIEPISFFSYLRSGAYKSVDERAYKESSRLTDFIISTLRINCNRAIKWKIISLYKLLLVYVEGNDG